MVFRVIRGHVCLVVGDPRRQMEVHHRPGVLLVVGRRLGAVDPHGVLHHPLALADGRRLRPEPAHHRALLSDAGEPQVDVDYGEDGGGQRGRGAGYQGQQEAGTTRRVPPPSANI